MASTVCTLLLFFFFFSCFVCLYISPFAEAVNNVTYDSRSLIINGERKLLISAAIHYPRSVPAMWPGLVKTAKEGGVDVIETYVFWNGHEPSPGNYYFGGRYDLAKFVKIVQEAGMLLILRIGPFVAAEWNFGGIPVWLHYVPGTVFRTDNEPFKHYMQNFTTLIVNMMKKEKFFASQGGPIILSQVENEYGFYEAAYGEGGKAYTQWAAKMALSQNTGVPWIMCQQWDAPDPVLTYEEVFESIFEYIDRILKIVRPRKLLFMAIDGVAPRAKMNQQRTRRFRNTKDHEILGKEEDRLRKRYELEGRDLLPMEEVEVSDSNVITPGTEFMAQLSKRLQSYIRLRISNNSVWKQLKVILSDSNAPGEGEHKIMSFIRLQRTCPGYNPNTSHVLYGLDADLIMLALASHEVHFSILRGNVLDEGNTRTSNSTELLSAGNSEANVAKCRGSFNQFDLNQDLKDTVERINSLDISSEISKRSKSLVKKKPYQFLHVWILREYLSLELKMTNLPEKFVPDIERLIDDFIFICFFAGNDFLPHMPTLEIHEGAIDLLIHVYKEEFKNLGGYLVDVQKVNDEKGGYIKLKRMEKFILAVGTYEDKIFTKRSKIRESRLRRMLRESENARGKKEEDSSPDGDSSCSVRSPNHDIVENTKKLKEQLESYARKISDVSKNGLVTDVKLGDHGWKNRYYKYKFSAETEEDMEKTRKNLVAKYTQGLCWVLLYYFSGVPSWTWFYPFHYGPFASDLKGLSSTKTMFQKGKPFKPFDQLMAVLPPRSAHALPVSYQSLMTDLHSSILDFYPTDFDVDTDGKKFLWQGICKLPFIEEERLLALTKKLEKELSEEEAKRNAENVDQLFIHKSENFALQFINAAGSIKQNIPIKIDTNFSGEINGFVQFKQESEDVGDSNGLANSHDVLCVYYQPPCSSLHIPHVLEGTTIPETVVSESDIDQNRQLWHDTQGYQGRINRSYNHVQAGAKTNPNPNPNVGFSSTSSPGVIIRGGGSGWNPRGRGYNNATRSLNDQTSAPYFSDGYGRGSARGNNSSYQRSRWTDSPINNSFEQKSRMLVTQSTRYPARTTANNANDQFWSVRTTGSGSGSKQEVQRWGGDTRSRNNDRW